MLEKLFLIGLVVSVVGVAWWSCPYPTERTAKLGCIVAVMGQIIALPVYWYLLKNLWSMWTGAW